MRIYAWQQILTLWRVDAWHTRFGRRGAGRSTFAWLPRVPSTFAGELCMSTFIPLQLTSAPGRLGAGKQAFVGLSNRRLTGVIT